MSEENLEEFALNGINAETGTYLDVVDPVKLVKMAIGADSAVTEEEKDDLNNRHAGLGADYGPPPDINKALIEEAGWGVIFAEDDPDADAIYAALKPLLDHRRAVVGDELYKEYRGSDGVRAGETKLKFLLRYNVDIAGIVFPEDMPYYLLIVGSPELIPFSFQYQLDAQFAIGRIHFDTIQAYANYAQSVVAAETGGLKLPREAKFFSVANDSDRATQSSNKVLMKPMFGAMNGKFGWDIELVAEDAAMKARLATMIGGNETPSLLFTACHGMGFPKGHADQERHQGALLCGDWGGRYSGTKPIGSDLYFSADDVGDEAKLHGMIAFHFACYGAGTPTNDDFDHLRGKQSEIADRPFVAGLPKRLLSHPNGGALAVIGHVERAWDYSFQWPGGSEQTDTFRSVLRALFRGLPVGLVVEGFNERYTQMSASLLNDLDSVKHTVKRGRVLKINDEDVVMVSRKWTATNDARSYIVVGDPAVKLMLADEGDTPQPRAAIKLKPASAPASAPAQANIVHETAPITANGNTQAADKAVVAAQPSSFDADIDPTLEGANFGLVSSTGDSLKSIKHRLDSALRKLADQMVKVAADVTSITVETYVSDEMDRVTYDTQTKKLTNANLRAYTHVKLDGDTRQVIPRSADGVDQELLDLHQSAVQQARDQRSRIMEAIARTAASLR